MTLKEIIQEKTDRLDSVPDAFVTATEKVQRGLLKEAIGIITQFETDSEGDIIPSKKNFALIEKLSNVFNKILFSDPKFLPRGEESYSEALHEFARQILKQRDFINDYFSASFDEFQFTDEYKTIYQQSAKQTISLFDGDAVQAQFIEPLKQQLGAVITSGSSMSEAIQSMTDYISGTTEADGKLLRYVKQVAYDGFAIADRQYTSVISQDLKAEWFLFEGGILKDSREFCVLRHGHYYHIKEIEKWANSDWQGKRAGTNSSTIFIFAGGYNCKHSILPVSVKIVPLADIERGGFQRIL